MISAQLYHPVFMYIVLIYTLISYNSIKQQNNETLIYGENSSINVVIITLALAVFVGLRPISGNYFGDTGNYGMIYEQMIYERNVPWDSGIEIGYTLLMYVCSRFLNVSGFFCCVDLLYFAITLFACKRYFQNNQTWAVLFCLGSFCCWGACVNGLRNGLACNLVLLAFSYLSDNKRDRILAFIIALCAYSFHHSTALPIVCAIVSLYYNNTKSFIYFWILSICISLIGGSAITNLFIGLGFDNRLDSYLTDENDLSGQMSHTGFRFDFLLYSAVPIILGWFIVVKQEIYDFNYKLLLNTYILANSFWIMVIRSSFSNRFAYLSWFIYPFLLAYPVLKLEIWPDQNKKAALLLLGNVMFTYVMFLMGK